MEYKKANFSNPRMGLDNKVCINPAYWCRLHEVWLSEEDVKKKSCRTKPTFDLISTMRCTNLEKKNIT
jgi:hypothetical protein